MELCAVLCLIAALIGGAVCLVSQSKPHGKDFSTQEEEIKRMILQRTGSRSDLIVQEVDIKSLVYLIYNPSLLNKLISLCSEITSLWKHQTQIPFSVNLDKIRLQFNRNTDGSLRELVLDLPPPDYDHSNLKINLDHFTCDESSCDMRKWKNAFGEIEAFAKELILEDLVAAIANPSFKCEARDAARFALAQFYNGIVPGIPVTIRFSDEDAATFSQAG